VKPFLVKLSCFLLLQFVIASGVYLLGQGEQGYYICALRDKQERLRTTPGPRLILVGGSGTAFGYDSAYLEETTGYTLVNTGLSAPLGLDFILAFAEAEARPGDVLLLSPEYSLLMQANREPNGTAVSEVAERCPEFLPYFGSKQPATRSWTEFLEQGAMADAQLAVERARKFGRRSGGVYHRSNFNEFGDMTANHGNPDLRSEQGPYDDLQAEELAANIARINLFVRRCREKQAHVVVTFHPVMHSLFEASQPTLKQIESELTRSLECPLILSPEEVDTPDELFFDTASHLNRQGVAQRSRQIAAALQQVGSLYGESDTPVLAERPTPSAQSRTNPR